MPRRIRELILFRGVWALFWGIVLTSLAVSMLLKFALHYIAPLSEETVASIGQAVGYAGALAFFVPTALTLTLNYRIRKLREEVESGRLGLPRETIHSIISESEEHAGKLREHAERINPLAFFLITLGFCFSI